jgi:hypothetical protein
MKLLMCRGGSVGQCSSGANSITQRRQPSISAAKGGITSGLQQPTCAAQVPRTHSGSTRVGEEVVRK